MFTIYTSIIHAKNIEYGGTFTLIKKSWDLLGCQCIFSIYVRLPCKVHLALHKLCCKEKMGHIQKSRKEMFTFGFKHTLASIYGCKDVCIALMLFVEVYNELVWGWKRKSLDASHQLYMVDNECVSLNDIV